MRQGGRAWSAAKPREVVPLQLLGLLRRACLAGAVLAVVLGSAASAAAHQLYVFANAEGRTIHGEAYFRGRVPAQDLPVRIYDPAGRELGQTQTDEKGEFTFEAREQCDHRFVVETGDGHRAEYVVPASELAGAEPRAALPGSEQTSEGPAAPEATAGAGEPAGTDQQAEQARSSPAEPVPLAARIEALQSQVGALRQDLQQYEQTMRLRDVLGGIGYIVGLAGVAFYFLGMRRKQRRAGQEDH